MAADSRTTLSLPHDDGKIESFTVSDNAQKVFALSKIPIGISSCGSSIIDHKTIADYIRVFEINKLTREDTILSAVEKLAMDLIELHIENSVIFQVCGYLNDEPYVYRIIGGQVKRQNINSEQSIIYNLMWNGELDALQNLLLGPNGNLIFCEFMPLKDAIDLSEFLVDVTIKYQRFQSKLATCGGPIDILVITKDYIKFFKHKVLNP